VNHNDWLSKDNIRPYVFVRKENHPTDKPGRTHKFNFPKNILVMDPLQIESADFASSILALENTAFRGTGLILPRWAFFDCAVMPGVVVGFAARTSQLSDAVRKVLPINDRLEWTPISLFICIPAVETDHWVAHNLCSVNSLLEKKDNYSCLGFLSKAFGLWYFNITNLYGVTQWKNPALGVHTNFGMFKLVTAYTPIHNIPASLTYLVEADARLWNRFIEEDAVWVNPLKHAGFEIYPDQEESLKALHRRIGNGEGPFYLSPDWDYKKSDSIPIFNL
jgi:hypothetical protein